MSVTHREGVFRLDTEETSYLFRVTERGHLEHLYYGARLGETNVESLRYKSALPHGNAVLYADDGSDYCLDELPTECATTGRGDYRLPQMELLMPDGNFTSDFLYKGYRIEQGSIPMKTLPSACGAAETLVISLQDAANNVFIDLYYGVFPTENVITRRLTLQNKEKNPLTVENLMSYCLDTDELAGYDMITLTGGWIDEARKTVRKIERGVYGNESRTGATSNYCNSGVILAAPGTGEESGKAYGFNLIYSGNHRTAVELYPTGLGRIVGGINPYCFMWKLGEGESFETPEAVLTFSEAGLNGLSRNFHGFVNNRIVRGPWQNRERPVLLNSWEACFFRFKHRELTRLARRAKKLGAELFVLDDGWFGARNDDRAGLGDYGVNRKKLPRGIEGLCSSVNKLGMDFGIWVEPESVNEDSELFRAHPDWVLKTKNRPPVIGRHQLLLDLGKKEVQDYIVKNVSALLDSCPIAYMKWDMNRHIGDFTGGECFHRYILGLYAVLERIFRPRPRVLLECCASGGDRFDLGMLCYGAQIWASDNTDPISRLTIQSGLSLFYPQSAWGSHISQAPHQQTLRVTPLFTRFCVSAFGAFGMELDLKELKPVEKRQLKELIAFYKEHRRLFQFGELQRIDGGDSVCWQVSFGEEAAALLVNTLREPAPYNEILTLKGLADEKDYTVDSLTKRLMVGRFGGLVRHIIPLRLSPNGWILRLADKYYTLPDAKEHYEGQGRTLKQGIRLKRRYIGTGYSKSVRMSGDFDASLYYIAERKQDQNHEQA